MKKKSNKPKAKQKQSAQEQAAVAEAQAEGAKVESRRSALRWLRNGAIALPVLGAGGVFTFRSVDAAMCEADLAKIGNGKPAFVQIHDPQCPMCRTLQKQVRRALRSFDGDHYNYLVANINTDEGRALARSHNVPHVTVLLFDPRGEMVQIVRGPSDADTLKTVFDLHLQRYA